MKVTEIVYRAKSSRIANKLIATKVKNIKEAFVTERLSDFPYPTSQLEKWHSSLDSLIKRLEAEKDKYYMIFVKTATLGGAHKIYYREILKVLAL